jgi:hypothetical protein
LLLFYRHPAFRGHRMSDLEGAKKNQAAHLG